MKTFKFYILHCLLCIFHCAASASAAADDDAVILMYHNIDSSTPESTSVTPATFKQHMKYLSDNEFIVWPLSTTLFHLATGRPIPPKTIVLTFDDAYISVYNEALPVLKEQGWPFTVFVTTQYIADGYTNFMSWQQLREIKNFGGEIGNHSLSHAYFIRKRNGETQTQWRERISYEIQQAQAILHQNIGFPILAVAYPYGEYSKEVREVLRQLGYFGIGQHSGVVSHMTDFQSIPRFPMATGFDGMESFAIKVAAKDLPVTVLSPADGVVRKNVAIPALTLRLGAGDYKRSGLRCYASGQGQIQLEWNREDSNVVTVHANEVIKPGRTKYNCTAPSLRQEGVFYWFSFLWMKPEADGSWYSE